jgi:hypothetical protein
MMVMFMSSFHRRCPDGTQGQNPLALKRSFRPATMRRIHEMSGAQLAIRPRACITLATEDDA